MSTNPLPKKHRLIPKNAKKVFSGVIFDIYQWQQEMFDGTSETFEMAKRSNSVITIGIVDDKILVVNETQPDGLVRQFSLPSGRVDRTDKSALEAARREMLEETGYTFTNWKMLNVSQPQPRTEWFVYLFVAWGVESINEPKLDSGEKIEVFLSNWPDFIKNGYQKLIRDSNLDQYKTVDELINVEEYSQ